jgi:peptidoglycan/LPS O-acetylase OafA/YrhL
VPETDFTSRHPRRLAAWLAFVLALALLSYGARLSDTETPDDLAYRYSSSVAALIQYGIMLGILLLIARGLSWRQVFALRRPERWARALGLAVLALLAIVAAALGDRRAG